MQQSKDELYGEVQDLLSKAEFEEEIEKRKKEYNDLLDTDTIALLLVDEKGRNKKNQCSIEDLHPGLECTVSGTITNINDIRKFDRKNGSVGRVINLELTDPTGSCGLVLWDKDVELVENSTIKIGSSVKVVNSYIKNGMTGAEINLGRWGMIEIDPEDITVQKPYEEKIENINSIRGKIKSIESTRSFIKDNGDFGFVANFIIQNEKGEFEITVWDEKVREIQKFKKGENIEINQIDIRNKNGAKSIHVNGKGIIKRL
jgi:replication factor A1